MLNAVLKTGQIYDRKEDRVMTTPRANWPEIVATAVGMAGATVAALTVGSALREMNDWPRIAMFVPWMAMLLGWSVTILVHLRRRQTQPGREGEVALLAVVAPKD